MARGNIRTIRGQIVVPEVTRIDLFDGKFTTGYRLKDFKITPQDMSSSFEIACRITTEDIGHTTNYDWSDNREIGWAAWNVPINSRFGMFSLVDEDSTIIEDIFLDPLGTSELVINYWIELERLTFSEAMGAMNMVRNRSQA